MNQAEIEDHLKQEAKFGQMGQQVVNNEAYKQAFTIREAHLFEVFCNTGKDQADIREEAWRTMQNLKALRSYFDEVLTTGKMATTQLEQLDKL